MGLLYFNVLCLETEQGVRHTKKKNDVRDEVKEDVKPELVLLCRPFKNYHVFLANIKGY